MNKFFLLLFIFFSTRVFSQDLGLISGVDARHFQLKNSTDTIDFILMNGQMEVQKPVIIFCQGSNPVPLVVVLASGKKIIAPLNFDYKKVSKDYHLVLISMPNTPVVAPIHKLNAAFCAVTDTIEQHSYFPSYLANNYFENYVGRANEVINFLSSQKWVNEKKIILFGHSQGSKIALVVALDNPKIYKVAYASGNPLGRIDQLIREQRKNVDEGKISEKEGQKQIEDIYDMWRHINEAPNAITTEYGDPNKTWTSFSKPSLDDLTRIKQPIYVVYGTKDINATFCDLLPIYFVRHQKNNLTLKPYLGLEHNFFEVDAAGIPIYSKGHWQRVIDDFLQWAK